MPILGAVAVPHPPIILPEIGKGEETAIQATINAYQEAMAFVARLQPETILLISPHVTMFSDWFEISPGNGAKGDFSRFGATDVEVMVPYDTQLANAIGEAAQKLKIPAGASLQADLELDHGSLIPLIFLNELYTHYKIVRIGLSGLPLEQHYQFGRCIAQAVKSTPVVVIASGDLSHKLTLQGPYGFAPEGPLLDKKIITALAEGDPNSLLSIPPQLAEKGAECGLRSFAIMAGTMDENPVEAHLLSYEGPFGVGYAVATWQPKNLTAAPAKRQHPDEYQQLAQLGVEHYITTGKPLTLPTALPPELVNRQAGVFVTLYKFGELRGCIGTIAPTTSSIAEEIIQNGISASSQDPRFPPVQAEELPDLKISVDVLGEAEPIQSITQLDPLRYGVIVTYGRQKGLLLPNLEGVDTSQQQVEIARQKGGIPTDAPFKLERFEVIRHE